MKKNKFTVGHFPLQVKRSLTGRGLFAVDPIPKGSCIIEYIGKPIPEKDQESASGRYLFWTGKKSMVDGYVKENKARFINHSCKPNCEADGPDGHVYIMALRTIKAGEELTYDYGDEYFKDYIEPVGCKCLHCRKKQGL